MLQLAYFLGCNEVYILGLDHDYGQLPELFPPGKISITKENYHLVQDCHFDKNYYKIGDVIGVPYVEKQEQAYKMALDEFLKDNRKIVNANFNSKLQVFPKVPKDFNLSEFLNRFKTDWNILKITDKSK